MNHCTACIFDALWWIGLQNIVKYEWQLWWETLNLYQHIDTSDRAQLGLLYSCSFGWRGHSLWNKNWTSTSRQSGCIRSKLDGMPEQWATHQMVGSATRFRGVSRRPQNQSKSVKSERDYQSISEFAIHATIMPIIKPEKINAHHTFSQNKICCNAQILIKSIQIIALTNENNWFLNQFNNISIN